MVERATSSLFSRVIGQPFLVVTLLLMGCGGSDQNSTVSAGDDAVGDGQRIAEDYIKEHGAALDACIIPPPAMRGPGAIQTVGDDAKPQVAAINRLVIAIDASGSMGARSGGETKMDAAKRAAIAFLGSVPTNTQVGLVAFGHQGNNLPSGKDKSCRGVQTIYPIGMGNAQRIEAALGQVRPTGWTPLAAAITTAAQSFAPSQTPGAQVVYVVSDGLETCGGDPVAAARTINQGPVKAIVNVIGFDLTAADRAQLSAVAAAGGGSFVEVKAGGDVGRAMDEVRRKATAVKAITTEYFDAGARTTDNNLAVGKYLTNMNFCLARSTSAETIGLQARLAGQKAVIAVGVAALDVLRRRHEDYHNRSTKIASELTVQAKAANDAIGAQQRSSETRLKIKP